MTDKQQLQAELDWLLGLVKRGNGNSGSIEISDTLKREIEIRIAALTAQLA